MPKIISVFFQICCTLKEKTHHNNKIPTSWLDLFGCILGGLTWLHIHLTF